MMKKSIHLIVALLLCSSFSVFAQSEYNVISGPSSFMQLNNTGDDFEAVDMNTATGYTFYHSYLDVACPWSVVSEDDGANIYTKLDMINVTNYRDVYMVSPTVNLSADALYKYSQIAYAKNNVETEANAYVQVQLRMVQGNSADFSPDSLTGISSIRSDNFFTGDEIDLIVDAIQPPVSGNYYFVISFTGHAVWPGHVSGLYLAFKENLICDNDYVPASVEKELVSQVQLFPNPTTGDLILSNYSGALQVLDISGRVFMNVANYAGETLDVSTLSSGIYLVNSTEGVLRFIKQ